MPDITPSASSLGISADSPQVLLGFTRYPAAGAAVFTGAIPYPPPALQHSRVISRALRFPLVHSRDLLSGAGRFPLQHTRQVIRTVGASLPHSRAVLPAAIFTLFASDASLPTALVDKT